MDEQGACKEELGAYLFQDGDSTMESISEGELVVLASTSATQSRAGDRDQDVLAVTQALHHHEERSEGVCVVELAGSCAGAEHVCSSGPLDEGVAVSDLGRSMRLRIAKK